MRLEMELRHMYHGSSSNNRRRSSMSNSREGPDRRRWRRRSRSRSTPRWGSDKRRRRSRSRARSTSRCSSDKRRRRSRSRSASRVGRRRGGDCGHCHLRTRENPHLYEIGQHAHENRDGDRNDQTLFFESYVHEDNQKDQQNDPGEDFAKQVENIRQRRREILEKHKKQEQSGGIDNIVESGVSDSIGDTELFLDESFSTVSCLSFLQNGFPSMPSPIRTLKLRTKHEKDLIFGQSPSEGQNQDLVRCDGLPLEMSGLSDNWDDAEGYYCHRIGEVLDGRFEVTALHGRGVFSSVVRARALKPFTCDSMEVAIKIIRNNAVMLKSGQQELNILKRLDGVDPHNKWHCVRFLTSLVYRNHLCLVFESMHMSLREALKKYGCKTGFSLGIVRVYAKQLFLALKHLRNCGVLHCDIKPDNMLVSEARNVLKLCDFGSAMFRGDNEPTPYLVSRFYRAPEIILGLAYDHALDMWSVGCCLYEFFTGNILFPGATNNDMLRLHMELKGPFPKKMLKKACFVSEHFDKDFNFCAVRKGPITKASIRSAPMNVEPKGIDSFVRGQGIPDENAKLLRNFKDMLDKILKLDPGKRLTVSQALNHPFITGT